MVLSMRPLVPGPSTRHHPVLPQQLLISANLSLQACYYQPVASNHQLGKKGGNIWIVLRAHLDEMEITLGIVIFITRCCNEITIHIHKFSCYVWKVCVFWKYIYFKNCYMLQRLCDLLEAWQGPFRWHRNIA